MNIFSRKNSLSRKNISRSAAVLAVAAGLSLAAGAARADDPTTMAPPVGASSPESFGNGALDSSGVNASADSVFNWQEIPADQQVPLTRATFDQGGYQLYDTQGETIVIPFTNQNLYVMKFATSPNGTLYFENTGGYPVLYVPRGGFVENATVAGARWYPFGQDFHPTEPVFLGIAPSYTEFVDLGWYPNTYFYGGYYGHESFLSGGIFLPTVGLFFSIGGHPYYGWNSYHRYYEGHPGFFRTHYYNRNFYHYAGSNYRTFAPNRRFGGGFHGDNFHAGNGFHAGGGDRYYHAGGGDHGNTAGRDGFVARPGFGGNAGGRSESGGRVFRGSSNFGGGRTSGGSFNHAGGDGFRGGNSSHTDGQNFGGGQRDGGGIGGAQTYTHTFRGTSNGGGQSLGGGQRGGGQTFGGSQNSGSSRTFGGSQNSSGGQNSSGSHSFSGGGQTNRTFSGGGVSRTGGGGGRQDNARQNGGGKGQDGGGHQDGGGRAR